MFIELPFTDHILPKEFGKNALPEDTLQGNPVRSFPFKVRNLPKGTKYLAISLIDYDVIPVRSFPWVHWLVSDIDVTGVEITIPENYSREYEDTLIQGKNSFSSPLLGEDFSEIDSIFVGPTPPDKNHRYTLEVFALSEKTGLEKDFYYNELLDSVYPILLDRVSVEVIGQY
ncbi:YbhB/YbcL family Raf kinase inhibitor-like protein [Streptococcus sp. 121]|uniref:YbhB/YbcL family Raf kinase inhibitor-like protein n=1 Tax=Streptococcus sp. 121 TaxID=2797637 RepID=UPI0018F10666|nr:YbhB/YbcL family Raf kinase inhibitor-like protein [Streptococcus sp. 121]MBJ6746707.1 YbhB/YbcL family Raf kinase inhibitor-like protein [Streptococcus sp. 121]